MCVCICVGMCWGGCVGMDVCECVCRVCVAVDVHGCTGVLSIQKDTKGE